MTEPFLNLPHGNTVRKQQAGAAMSQIVVPDVSQPICLEQLRKALRDIVGLDQIANLVDTYILKIVLDVAASAQSAVFLLLFFQCEKSFPHERNERQGSYSIWSSWCQRQPEYACRRDHRM